MTNCCTPILPCSPDHDPFFGVREPRRQLPRREAQGAHPLQLLTRGKLHVVQEQSERLRPRLALDGMLFEVDAIAVLAQSNDTDGDR